MEKVVPLGLRPEKRGRVVLLRVSREDRRPETLPGLGHGTSLALFSLEFGALACLIAELQCEQG